MRGIMVRGFAKASLSSAWALCVLALACLYLYGWRNLPLFPDEVALRIQSARSLVDGFIIYPVFPQCGNGSPMALPFYPVAYLLSAWDMAFGWSHIRLLAGGVILASLVTVLVAILRSGPHLAAGLLAYAFIGVAGSGLLMMRMELFMILQAAACLVAFLILRSRLGGFARAGGILTVVFASILAAHVHPQALILFPAALALVGGIGLLSASRVVSGLAALGAIWLLWAAGAAGSRIKFTCGDTTAVFDWIRNKTILGETGMQTLFSGELLPWTRKIDAYAQQFLFQKAYPIDRLPGISEKDLQILMLWNDLIYWSVILFLLFFIILFISNIIIIVREILNIYNRKNSNFHDVFRSGAFYIVVFSLPHILYFFYDTEGAFYRAYYFNFVFVSISALSLSRMRGWAQIILVPPIVLGVALSFVSINETVASFDQKFIDGWAGPSLSLQQDGTEAVKPVQELARACGIASDEAGLVVDDFTYLPLKSHRGIVPWTYAGLGRFVIQGSVTTTGLMADLKHMSSAVLLRCENMAGVPVPGMIRQGDLCCIKFHPGPSQ